MTVIQMQRESRSDLAVPEVWEAPEVLDFEDDESDLEPIEFPEIFTSVPSEQPTITGDDSGE
jgi:hypothetical protein